jgi:hypothetical protein
VVLTKVSHTLLPPLRCIRVFDRTAELQQVQYSCSVDIRPEWAVKEQVPFQSLQKLTCRQVVVVVGSSVDARQAGGQVV